MSILDRLNRLIRSNLNSALEGGGRGSFESALKEMEGSLREARRQQAEMRRNERELIQDIREARDEADEWEERAILALQSDDEQLAREALKVKNQARRKAEQLREELREHRSHMDDINASLEALEMKLQSQKKRLSEGRSSRRSTGGSTDRRARRWERKMEERRGGGEETRREPPTEYDETFDTSSEFETFDRMAGKIDTMEAEIEAMRELSGDYSGDSRRARLERIFRRMEGQSEYERTRRKAEAEETSEEKADRRKDNLSDMKRRIDRLSELKDKFGDDEENE